MNYVAHIPLSSLMVSHINLHRLIFHNLPDVVSWLLFLLAFQDLKIPAAGEMVKSWLLHDACPTLFVVRF